MIIKDKCAIRGAVSAKVLTNKLPRRSLFRLAERKFRNLEFQSLLYPAEDELVRDRHVFQSTLPSSRCL